MQTRRSVASSHTRKGETQADDDKDTTKLMTEKEAALNAMQGGGFGDSSSSSGEEEGGMSSRRKKEKHARGSPTQDRAAKHYRKETERLEKENDQLLQELDHAKKHLKTVKHGSKEALRWLTPAAIDAARCVHDELRSLRSEVRRMTGQMGVASLRGN